MCSWGRRLESVILEGIFIHILVLHDLWEVFKSQFLSYLCLQLGHFLLLCLGTGNRHRIYLVLLLYGIKIDQADLIGHWILYRFNLLNISGELRLR